MHFQRTKFVWIIFTNTFNKVFSIISKEFLENTQKAFNSVLLVISNFESLSKKIVCNFGTLFAFTSVDAYNLH